MANATNVPDARQRFFGTRITPMTFSQWLASVSRARELGQRQRLSGHHNLHSLFLLHRLPVVRQFYARCTDCYIDGVPVRLLLRAFGTATSGAQRFSLMDDFLELLAHAERHDWSIFYLGSRESVVDEGRALIARRFPELRIRLRHGYDAGAPALIHEINAWRPDVLLVGMGMPLQEQWLVDHLDGLDVGVAAQAGATLDYYTGAQARPPRWMGRLGLAWAFRLAHDPARLWRRYLIEPWGLLLPALKHWREYRRSGRTHGE